MHRPLPPLRSGSGCRRARAGAAGPRDDARGAPRRAAAGLLPRSDRVFLPFVNGKPLPRGRVTAHGLRLTVLAEVVRADLVAAVAVVAEAAARERLVLLVNAHDLDQAAKPA